MYIEESKRCWKSRGAENKPVRNGNVGFEVKQHAKTTGHNMHLIYASNLKAGMKNKGKSVITFIPGQKLC